MLIFIKIVNLREIKALERSNDIKFCKKTFNLDGKSINMSVNKFYFDDPEGEALSSKTSHPNFVKLLKASFYYDCLDEFSPFGNDEGADLLYNLEDWYQENNGKGNIVQWLFDTIDGYGFKYKSESYSKILDESVLKQIETEDPHCLACMDNTIIAAAFGQYKISGQINKELKEVALIALKRQLLLTTNFKDSLTKEYVQRLQIMTKDLSDLK
jgi:uncharacterized protein YfeS